MLVMNHGRGQHFFGELQELDRKMTGDHGRILDEVRNFLQQRRMSGDESADAPAEPPRVRFELASNLRLALATIEDNEVLEQPRPIVVERLHLDGAPRPAARRQKTMAVGVRSRADVLDERALRVLGTPDDERHHSAAVQENQPPDRPREHQLAFSVFQVRVPAHLLWKRQVAQ